MFRKLKDFFNKSTEAHPSPKRLRLPSGLGACFPEEPRETEDGDLIFRKDGVGYLQHLTSDGPAIKFPSCVKIKGNMEASFVRTPEGPKLESNYVLANGVKGRYNRMNSDHGESVLFRQLDLGKLIVKLFVWGPSQELTGAVPFLFSFGQPPTMPETLYTSFLPMPSQTVRVRQGDFVLMKSQGASPWFDPSQEIEREMTFMASKAVETDSLEKVKEICTESFAPYHRSLVYQHWGATDENGLRAYHSLDQDSGTELGQLLQGGPVERLALLVTSFAEGALRGLSTGLGDHSLRSLALFFSMSGDDLTDTPYLYQELSSLVRRHGVRQLSILSRVFNQSCEDRLSEALAGSGLSQCRVYLKPEQSPFRRIETPKLDALRE